MLPAATAGALAMIPLVVDNQYLCPITNPPRVTIPLLMTTSPTVPAGIPEKKQQKPSQILVLFVALAFLTFKIPPLKKREIAAPKIISSEAVTYNLFRLPARRVLGLPASKGHT